MVKKLKGVIFSITDVLCTKKVKPKGFNEEIKLLMNFLKKKSITPVVLANREWTVGGIDAQTYYTELWGRFRWFVTNRDHIPKKQSKLGTQYVLNEMGWDTTDAIYVGNSKDDMITAVNGNMLFLNAEWFGSNCDYGFKFDSPKDIARFVDTFCLRDHLWHYVVEHDDLKFYSLGVFTYHKPYAKYYSEDANATLKKGRGHPDFWTKYLVSSIYFSELFDSFHYVAPYPGHKAGSFHEDLYGPIDIFAKCFKKKLIPDLLIRHTDSIKSQTARNEGRPIDHKNQLNTIRLNPHPINPSTMQPYKKTPLKPGKTVLIIDDICTEGYSLEAARQYLKQTGVKVICVSWLKTINRGYTRILDNLKFEPYQENTFNKLRTLSYDYHKYTLDPQTTEEIDRRLRAYLEWDWPSDL